MAHELQPSTQTCRPLKVRQLPRALNDITVRALHKALDGDIARQRAAAHNVANVDTPGYHPVRVEFQAELRTAIERERRLDRLSDPSEGIETVRPETVSHEGPALRRDGNAVDIEAEMTEIAESALHYQATVRLLNKKLQMLRSVATEGGRL